MIPRQTRSALSCDRQSGDDSPLLSGISAKVTAATRSAESALIIPIDTITYDADGSPYVLVYEDGRAAQIYVTLGITTRSYAQVTGRTDA